MEKRWHERVIVSDTQRIARPMKWRKISAMMDKRRLVRGKELCDLSTDPGQRIDLADRHADIVLRLRAKYEKWWGVVSAQLDRDVPWRRDCIRPSDAPHYSGGAALEICRAQIAIGHRTWHRETEADSPSVAFEAQLQNGKQRLYASFHDAKERTIAPLLCLRPPQAAVSAGFPRPLRPGATRRQQPGLSLLRRPPCLARPHHRTWARRM